MIRRSRSRPHLSKRKNITLSLEQYKINAKLPTTPQLTFLSDQRSKKQTKNRTRVSDRCEEEKKIRVSADAFTKHLTICEIEWNNAAHVEEVKSIGDGESVEVTRLMPRNEVFCLLYPHNNI